MNNSLDIIINKLKEQKLSEEEAKIILTDLKQTQSNTDVAVIGMSGQFPDALDVETLWNNMMEGHSSIRILPDSYLVTEYSNTYSWGGILEERDCFDPLFFNIAPCEAESMNPHQRLVLQESYKALEDSGYDPKLLKNSKVGLFIGAEPTGYLDESFTGYSDALIASRLSYYLDLKGSAMVVNTGCSSSAVALQLAYESIQNGDSEIAVVGGVSAFLDQKILGRLSTTGMLSLTGEVRTFDEDADGTVISEGVGVVVLKSLEVAKKNGDHIYGVIKGIGIGQDGTSNGITAPNGNAQEQLIVDTYEKYHIQPSDISYIETHGTGTKLGDPIEVNALIRAFSTFTDKRNYCALGSIKTYIGHTSAASGVIGLIKILLSMKYHRIPGQTNLKKMNPLINIKDTPFTICKETTEWEGEKGKPLMAALNTFGHSGTNVHIVIKEYTEEVSNKDDQEKKVLFFPYSAKSEQQLKAVLVKNLQLLEEENISTSEIYSWIKQKLCSILQLQEKEISSNDLLVDFGLDLMQQELLLKEIEKEFNYCVTSVDLQTISSINKLAEYIVTSKGKAIGTKINLRDMAYTLQVGREDLEKRVIFLASRVDELTDKIRAYIRGNNEYSGVWTGYHKQKKKAESTDESNIKQWYEKGEYDLIAKNWINGTFSKWHILYENEYPRRISLPTYEFAKEHYWKREAIRPAIKKENELHIVLTGTEYYIKDHILEGEAVVPGSAYIMMALEALKNQFEEKVLAYQMNHIGFLSPVVYRGQNIPISVQLEETEKNRWNYSVISENQSDLTSNIHSQGVIRAAEKKEDKFIDLEEVRQQCCSKKIDDTEFYQLYEELNVQYGSSHQGVREVVIGDGILMARLQLLKAEEVGKEIAVIHPGLLDSVFQTTFLFDYVNLDGSKDVTRIKKRLPFAIEELVQYREWTSQVYAVVKERKTEQVLQDILKYDIDISDYMGNVVMSIMGFTMKKIVQQTDGLVLFQPRWKEVISDSIDRIEYEDRYVICIHSILEEVSTFQPDWNVTLIEYEKNNTIEKNFNRISKEIFLKVKEILQKRYKKKILLQIIFSNQEEMICLEGLGGLIRTLRLENPNIIGQLVEVDSYDRKENLQKIASMIMQYSQFDFMSYHNQQMQRLAWGEIESDQVTTVFRDHGVYLVTGGTGKIAQIFVKEMIRQANNITIILVGRTPMNESIQKEISDICDSHATIAYEQGDISDYASCSHLIEKIKAQYHVLNGILHTAGINKDNFIIRKGIEEFEEVLAPKVKGAYNLDILTKDIELDFMVYFASGSGAVGNIGQSDYAVGNAFMDSYAKYRNQLVDQHQRFGRTYSIDWPLWKNGGMSVDADTEQRLEDELGMKAISDDKGTEAFYRILHSNEQQIYTVYGNKKKILNHLIDKLDKQEKVENSHVVATIEKVDLVVRAQDYMKKLLSDTIRFPAEQIDVEEALETYGIDSILILNMTKQLEKVFGLLPKTLFFEYQNIAELTEYFIENYRESLLELLQISNKDETTYRDEENQVREVKGKKEVTKGKDEIKVIKEIKEEDDKIAIIGISGRYPGGDNCEMFWETLKEGKDCISEIPEERWNHDEYYDEDKEQQGKTYTKWGGFIRGVDQFDPKFFNITPYEAELLDPQERLFLECVYHTIEDAGYTRQQLSQKGSSNEYRNVGVYVGVMYEEYQLYGAEEILKGNPISLGGSQASIANRISYYCDFHGPSMAVDSMCSSSLTAVSLACQSILNGTCETAIAGGVNVSIHPNKYIMLAQGRFASSKGKCESFGEGGDGYVPGEGVGAILLKPLNKAIKDGDHIYGVIRAAVVNHGGKTNGYSVPNPVAQADVINQAINQAQINPRMISYIEAHGTGTKLGDPIEILGLKKAFESYTDDKGFCAIGSVKSNIGHCEGAAGIAGITKVLLQLKHKTLVPSIHSDTLNENIDFNDSPFYIQHELKEWRQPTIVEGNQSLVAKRCAGISSFGAGGSNAHIIIEEYCEPQREYLGDKKEVVIVLSAKSLKSLKNIAKNLLVYIRKYKDSELLEDVAYTLQTGRENMKYRIGFICKSFDEMEEKLNAYVNGIQNSTIYQGESDNIKKKETIVNAEDNMEQVIQAFVTGSKVEWSSIIDTNNRKRVSLPGYSFDESTYWYKKSANNLTYKIYPFIESNESDFESQHFTVTIYGNETFLKDHVVHERKTFPAAAYIEMVREAAEISFSLKNKSNQTVELKQISFNQPLYIEDESKKLEIELYIDGNGNVIFEIYELVGENKEKIYCQGQVAIRPNNGIPRVSVDDLFQKYADADNKIEKEQCYEMYNKLGIRYGQGMQGVEKIFCGTQCLLANISVKNTGERFILNPAVIDSGFQSLIGFDESQRELSLPYAISMIEIFKKSRNTTWVYIEKNNKNASLISFDLTFCDDSGEVCMKIHQFVSRKKNTTTIVNKQFSDSEIYESYFKSIVASVTKLPSRQIDALESFDSLGVDSVMIMKMTSQLENAFGLLPKTLFFEYQNIRQLSGYFKEEFKVNLDRVVGNNPHKSSLVIQNTKEQDKDEIFQELISDYKIRKSEIVAQDSGHSLSKTEKEDIAIIGLAGSYPMADDLMEFWANLQEGKDCITKVPKERWDYKPIFDEDKDKEKHIYTKWGGFINNVDKFDPLFFKISPREAELMDPQERLFLTCAYEAVEDAGYTNWLMNQEQEGKNIGVYVGVMYEEYQLYGVEEQMKGNMIALHGNSSSIANRVSYYFNFNGPSMAVNTMCSSSLSSIHLACQSILNQECEMALAGGVNLNLHQNKYLLISEGKFASTNGKCASFGENGDGYVPGEGVGAVLLKPLRKAVDDGDHIYGVIKGTSLNHGGRTNGYTVPSPQSQSQVISRTFEQANVSPASISYVEAHGTGTSLGDPVEITGLMKVFEPYTQERQFCSIGSVKSNIGHCEGAAGIAAVTKVLLQLKYKTLVPSLHSKELNKNIDFLNTPFKVQQTLEEWKRPIKDNDVHNAYPLRACISSFGAGGSNAHIILEEYTNITSEEQLTGPYIVLLTAKTKEQLRKVAERLYSYMQKNTITEKELRNLAYTLQVGRYHMEERLALIVEDEKSLRDNLQQYVNHEKNVNPFNLYEGRIMKAKDSMLICNQDEDMNQMIDSWISKGKFNKLISLWVEGFDIDWNSLYTNAQPQRSSLPTYPFEEEHYWVPREKREPVVREQKEKSLEDRMASIIDNIINDDSTMEDAIQSIRDLI